jgi:hypothetical protein
MKLSFSPEDEQFRVEVATWMQENLTGKFEKLKFRGGPGDEHTYPAERLQWEQKLAEGRLDLCRLAHRVWRSRLQYRATGYFL